MANLKHAICARLKNSIDESEWEKVRLMCEIMEEFALIRFHSHCPQKYLITRTFCGALDAL